MKKLITLLLCLVALNANSNDIRKKVLMSIDNEKVAVFINSIWTDAEAVCKEKNLPLGLLIAQACLESGFGTSNLAINKCNFLGIKRKGSFQEYETQKQCFYDWSKVLHQKCYSGIEFRTTNGYIYLLESCGYAESKRYVKDLKSIVRKYNLNLIQ